MKIVCVADTHRQYDKLKIPEADVLIHCGDLDAYEFVGELTRFNSWLGTVPCEHKLIIAGNHDGFLERSLLPIEGLLYNGTYLEGNGIELDGVVFWGSPITPVFGNWFFMRDGEERKTYWDIMWDTTDILFTHGPPMDILDTTIIGGHHAGCQYLAKRIKEVKPKVHCFGHIHEQYGIEIREHTTYINCSVVDEGYALVNEPVVFEFNKSKGELIL